MGACYDVVDATPQHIDLIARRARQADIDECWAQCCMTVRDGLKLSLASAAIARVGRADREPGVIYGVINAGETGGQIWMVGTDLIDQHRRGFLEKSLSEIADFQLRYDRLWNYIDARNSRALRWLQWLGFEISPAQPHGPLGLPFHFFCRLAGESRGTNS